METLKENKYGHGAVLDKYDSRDYKYRDIAGAGVPFNWDIEFDIESVIGKKLPIKDQGSSSSCGGQAWSYLAEVLECVATGSFEERSAKYVYAQTHVPGGGSSARDNADIFCKQGVAREQILPSYPNTEPNLTASIDITDDVRRDARSAMSLPYAWVNMDINSVAEAIRDNYGVVIGVDGQNNGSWLSKFPRPPISTEWRHWLYAGRVKMIDGIKYIGVCNSWGDKIGDNGWQWIGEDYFMTGHVFTVISHVFKPLPVTFENNLKFGDKGVEVIKLQKVLRKLGFFTYHTNTGNYLGETQKAVLQFQLATGIVKFGIESLWGYFCGPKTRQALNGLKVDLLT